MFKESLLQRITNIVYLSIFNVQHSSTLRRRRKSWQT